MLSFIATLHTTMKQITEKKDADTQIEQHKHVSYSLILHNLMTMSFKSIQSLI